MTIRIQLSKKRLSVGASRLGEIGFQYREPMKAKGSGAEYGADYMWVKTTVYGNGCLIGALDSSPQYTKLLKSGDTGAFHPNHIIAFWHP